MKRYLSFILIISLTANAFAKMPQNISCAKRAVINYYNSGEYVKDVDLVVKDAEQYLDSRVKTQAKPLAIVLDIDDTSLSNFLGNKKRDFSGLPDAIYKSYLDADAPAIEPVLRLFNEAIKSGIKVFFVSFRPESVRSYTITNLHNAGYYGWEEIFLPNEDEEKKPAQIFKTRIREMLTQKGYDIILNLGDQDSDLAGGFADHVNKIPNPLYTSGSCENSSSCAALSTF